VGGRTGHDAGDPALRGWLSRACRSLVLSCPNFPEPARPERWFRKLVAEGDSSLRQWPYVLRVRSHRPVGTECEHAPFPRAESERAARNGASVVVFARVVLLRGVRRDHDGVGVERELPAERPRWMDERAGGAAGHQPDSLEMATQRCDGGNVPHPKRLAAELQSLAAPWRQVARLAVFVRHEAVAGDDQVAAAPGHGGDDLSERIDERCGFVDADDGVHAAVDRAVQPLIVQDHTRSHARLLEVGPAPVAVGSRTATPP